MPDDLISNIILRSKFEKPTGTGLKELLTGLTTIKTTLEEIESKTWKIKVELDDAGLRQLGINLSSQMNQAGQAAGRAFNKGVNQTAGGTEIKRRRVIRTNAKGETSTSITGTSKARDGLNEIVTKLTDNLDTGASTEDVTVTDILAKLTDKRRGKRQENAIQREVIKEEQERKDALIAQYRQHRKAGGSRKGFRSNLATADDQLLFDEAILERQKGSADTQRKILAIRQKRDALAARNAIKEINDAENAENAQQRKMLAAKQKLDRRAARDAIKDLERQEADQEEQRRVNQANARVASLPGKGFKRTGSVTSLNLAKNRQETTDEFTRVRRTGLGQYEVDVVKANRATGKLTESMLTGAGAARKVGDSFQHAVEKVGLWLSATGVVFASIRGFQAMVKEILAIEQGTVLLARVGKNLGTTWEDQSRAAAEIRDRILDITAVTGGDAAEALNAASTFARAGQTKKEVIESTTAALIASKVAEIDVVEASEFLASAYLQFNLSATETLGILDQLNTLSNRYRVTTDDLFQGISRAGSVIAQQNGRLSELAAVIAVTSQVTARSGAEIGNAVKTISSNLGRADTKNLLFEKLAVSAINADGTAKTYTQTLLELSLRLNQLAQAEQAEIATQIAGVRQRNQLVAQLRNVAEVLKAENFAVFDSGDSAAAKKYGSAIGELDNNSQTLSASLDRLRAEAVKLSQVMSGPAVEVARDMVTILSAMSAVLSAGGGTPARLAVLAGVVGTVVVALKYLHSSIVGVNASMVATSVRMVAASLSAYVMAKSTERATESLVRLNIASKAAIGSLVTSYGAYAAVALVVYALVEGYQQLAERENRLLELAKDTDAASDKTIQKERRKAEQYSKTAEALAAYIREVERLEATGKSGDKDEARRLRKEASGIAASANLDLKGGLKTGDAGSRQIVELRRQGVAAELEAAKAAEARLRELKKGSLDAQKRVETGFEASRDDGIGIDFQTDLHRRFTKREELNKISDDKLRTAAEGESGLLGRKRTLADRQEFADRYLATVRKAAEGDVNAARDLQLLEQGMYDMDDALIKTGKSLKEVVIETARYGDKLEEQERFVEALTNKFREQNLVSLEREIRIEDITRKLIKLQNAEEFLASGTRSITDFLGSDSDYQQLNNRISETAELVKQLTEDLSNAPPGFAKQYLPALVKQEEVLNKFRQGQQKIRLETAKSATGQALENTFSLSESSLLESKRQSELLNPEKFTGESSGLRDLDAKIAAARTDIKSLIGLGKDYEEARKNAGTDEQRDEATGGREAVKLRLQQQLLSIAELEVQRANELRRVETEIAEARKRSADEAARALGTLSEEDKLRVLVQAKYFKDNPHKVLSVREQFFADSKSVSLGQQFFNGHFGKRIDPTHDPLEKLLKAGGFGGDYDADRAAKELAARRRGWSDEEINREAAANAAYSTADADRLRTGGFRVEPNLALDRDGQGYNKNGRQDIDLTVRPQLVDLGPVLVEFQEQLNKATKEQIAAARAALAEAEARNRRIKEPAPAVTDGG